MLPFVQNLLPRSQAQTIPAPDTYSPIVQELLNGINRRPGWKDNFETAIAEAVHKAPAFMKQHNVASLDDFYRYIDNFLKWVPSENETATQVLQRVRVFYFLFNQDSVKGLQSSVHPDGTHAPLSWLSQWMVDYARELGEFMNTPESLSSASLNTFRKSEKYNLDNYIEPAGGWKTFNEFFARQIKPELRPITAIENPNIITSPADSIFQGIWPVDDNGIVTFKGISWRISDLLKDSEYKDDFNGGHFVHSILLPSDYHRMHAPIGGHVLESRIVQGQALLEVICEEGRPRSNPEKEEGYQWHQMRGLVVLDSPMGKVAILPVGMGHISSVVLTVKAGQELVKGQEISYFQFGGSDIIMVFQKRSNVALTAVKNELHPRGHYKVGEAVATAKPDFEQPRN